MTVQNIIPSYLYVQYADDDDLQGFVAAQNQLAQAFLDWFNTLDLPIYTESQISGNLLDWVATGLYGMVRPYLGSGASTQILAGPFNTNAFNTLAFNAEDTQTTGGGGTGQASDDIYKRILTFAFYKGDGKIFNIEYLKRRVLRFINGTDGTAPTIDQTYDVSLTFGAGNLVNIAITGAGSLASTLQAAIDCGALEMPFQYRYAVTAV